MSRWTSPLYLQMMISNRTMHTATLNWCFKSLLLQLHQQKHRLKYLLKYRPRHQPQKVQPKKLPNLPRKHPRWLLKRTQPVRTTKENLQHAFLITRLVFPVSVGFSQVTGLAKNLKPAYAMHCFRRHACVSNANKQLRTTGSAVMRLTVMILTAEIIQRHHLLPGRVLHPHLCHRPRQVHHPLLFRKGERNGRHRHHHRPLPVL